MVPVAYRILCCLRNQGLGVMQHQLLKLSPQVEFLLQNIRLYTITVTCALHQNTSWHSPAAEEVGNTGKPLISNDREPYRRTIFHTIYGRNNTGSREIQMSDRSTGFINYLSQWHE